MWSELMPVVTQLAATTVGVLVVVWQIGRQHKNSLRLQKEHQQDELKLSLYRDLNSAMSTAQEATAASSGYVSSMYTSLIVYWATSKSGFLPKPLSQRPDVFAEKHRLAYDKVGKLMVMLERYDIVNPNLRIFRTAFADALQDLTMAQIALYRRILSFLPVDTPPGEPSEHMPLAPRVPTLEEYNKEIKPLVEAYTETSLTLGTYIHDLVIEAQNILLGNLFESRVPRRKPRDPQYVAISTAPEDVKRLEEYFAKKIRRWEQSETRNSV